MVGARRHGGGFGDGGGSGVGGRGRGGHMSVPLSYLYSCLNMLRFAQVGYSGGGGCTNTVCTSIPKGQNITKCHPSPFEMNEATCL